jgi:hypothetical protein
VVGAGADAGGGAGVDTGTCWTGADGAVGSELEAGTGASGTGSATGATLGATLLGPGGLRSGGRLAAWPSSIAGGAGADSSSANDADLAGGAVGGSSSSRSAVASANDAAKRVAQAPATTIARRGDAAIESHTALTRPRDTYARSGVGRSRTLAQRDNAVV